MFTEQEKKDRREARKAARKERKELARIQEMKDQKPVKEFTITIEWKRSRTWGMNPVATAKVVYNDGSYGNFGPFTCSGAGYDKESTVIADVFNATLRYKLFKKLSGKHPYGMYYHGGEAPKEDGRDWYNVPIYNGGVGTSCYYKIAEFIGGTFERIASGKTFDVFKYSDKERPANGKAD